MRAILAAIATVILTASALGTAAPAAAVPSSPPPAGAPSYYPSGPQYDVPVATLESQGWTRCFQEPYNSDGNTLISALQAACDGDFLILTGRAIGSSTLDILSAAPRTDVFTVTAENAPRLVNGTYWYFTPTQDGDAQSMGFSTDEEIFQDNCDWEGGPVPGGLCWHINDYAGGPGLDDGYSLDGLALNSGDDYYREVYEASAEFSDWIFKITSLSSTALYGVDTENEIGDVRGGIGFCADSVLYRGDEGIGVYDIDDFSGGSIDSDSDEDWSDLYSTDILTKKAWAFTTWDDGSDSLSEITEIDCATGTLTDNVITLSPAIEYSDGGDPDAYFGVFSGYGRIVVADNVSGNIYDIDLPSGAVSLAATLDPETSPYFDDRETNEGDSIPGVAEYFEGAIHLVYPTTDGSPDTIRRMNVVTGETEIVFTVPEGSDAEWEYYIGDDPSFVVDCGNSRWYLGHEYGDETPWIYDELPAAENYDEPLIAFAAECYIQGTSGFDPNCGDVDLTVCPTIMPGTSGLIGAPGTSQTLNRATYTWLRCSLPGAAQPGPRPPATCRTIRSFKATGAQMAVRPYGVTARDIKSGYIRLAVKVGTRTFYSGAYDVAP